MSWEAHYEDPSALAHPRVRVILGRQALKIRDNDNILVASWSYRDLVSLVACQAGKPVVLGCSVSPHARLTVFDSAFGGELAPFAPQAVRLARASSWRRWALRAGALGFAAVAALVGWGLWRTIDVTLSRSSAQNESSEVVFALPNLCSGPAAGQKALETLSRRIANGGGLSEIPPVKLLQHAVPLSFPAPDGTVFLTQGLLSRLQSPSELAAIIAHELGHIAQGNHISTLRSLKLDSQDVVMSCQDEPQELEADAWALRALERAGLDASGLASFTGRLPQGMAGPWSKMLCPHPVTAERLRALRQDAPVGKRPPLSDADWQAVRTLCGSEGS